MSRAVTIAPEVAGGALAEALARPEALLASRDAVPIKDHLRTAVSRVQAGATELYVKRFKPYAWYRRLEAAWIGGPARRSWNMARRLAAAGFSPVPILAIVEMSRFGIPSDAYLVSAGVADAVPGSHVWLDGAAAWPFHDRRQLVREAGRSLRRLHDAGLYTRDANPNNFLVRRRADGAIELWLLDLEAYRDVGRVSRARRLKNLVQLHGLLHGHVSAGERLRLLRAYLRGDRRELRSWSEEAARLDREKRAEYARRQERSR